MKKQMNNELEPVLSFLKKLEQNNNRPWFEAHRSEYEIARKQHLAWVDKLLELMSRFDPRLSALKAADCVYRINRDVRFSKNKDPYKNNFGAYINALGKKSETAGYYVHLQPGNCFVAAGIWMPSGTQLAKLRQEIDYNFADFKKILHHSALKKAFPAEFTKNERLVRPPKGYTADNPALEYLKLKSFVISAAAADTEVITAGFLQQVSKTLFLTKPLIDFFNTALD